MPRFKTLTMTVGLSGSGKSTWAKEQVLKAPAGEIARINKDDLRAMLDVGRWAGNATEKHIVAARDALIATALTNGRSVIVDDTNLVARHETDLREIAARFGAVFVIQDFTHVDVYECIRRDAARPEGGGRVGKDVIHGQAQALAKRKPGRAPQPFEPYQAPDGAPTCVLVDIDGTVAEMAPNGRGPFDWHRVGEDHPRRAIIDLVRTLIASGENVIFMSGRSAVSRPATQAWLDHHVDPGLTLHMRADGDNRKDSIVKRELFEAHIAGKYDVKYVLDDRDQVVQMWRKTLGLHCLQVNYGNF